MLFRLGAGIFSFLFERKCLVALMMASQEYLCSFLLLFWRFAVQQLQVIYWWTRCVCSYRHRWVHSTHTHSVSANVRIFPLFSSKLANANSAGLHVSASTSIWIWDIWLFTWKSERCHRLVSNETGKEKIYFHRRIVPGGARPSFHKQFA